MADFSFSFDSDNPFAEPQAAPKPAPDATNKSDAPGDEPITPISEDVGSSSTSASQADEFSLDSLDFAFDGGASVNDSLPTQNTPDPQNTPRQQTPGEAALAEFDFGVPEADDETDNAKDNPFEQTPPDGDFLEGSDDFFVGATESANESASSDADLSSDVSNLTDETPVEPADESDFTTEVAAPTSPADDESASAFFLDFDESETQTEPPSEIVEIEAENLTFDEPSSIEEPLVIAEAVESETDSADASFNSVSDSVSIEEVSNTHVRAEARPRRLKTALSVAILGASGIGKNHARWFHRNGCEIVGFLGTSSDSTAQTEANLVADFPFDGTAYTDLGELLAKEKPDIVCVATPPSLHFGHVLQSLEAGAHVLCEKPLVYAPTRKFRENRDGAKELVKVAAKKKLVLGTQLQYGAATPILCKLAGLSPTDVGDFAMELETLNPNSSRDPRELWIDMGPHPISVAQMLAGPEARLAEETIRFDPYQDDEKTEVVARFGINCADGRLLMVRAVVRALRASEKPPRRRFSFNGHSVTYAPLAGAKGSFQAQFVAPDGYASVYADPVDYLIGDFVRACREGHSPVISGDFGRENLEWMLKVAGDK